MTSCSPLGARVFYLAAEPWRFGPPELARSGKNRKALRFVLLLLLLLVIVIVIVIVLVLEFSQRLAVAAVVRGNRVQARTGGPSEERGSQAGGCVLRVTGLLIPDPSLAFHGGQCLSHCCFERDGSGGVGFKVAVECEGQY